MINLKMIRSSTPGQYKASGRWIVSIKIVLFSLICKSLSAQILPMETAAAAALQRHPALKAASEEVRAMRYAEKTAWSIPNPELELESPTGEFYTLGFSQSFDFPTVYVRRKDVARAETERSKAGMGVTGNELRYRIRSLYLETQTAREQLGLLKRNDSLFQSLAAAAIRQFDAGEVDFLQKTAAESRAGETRRRLLEQKQLEALLSRQLSLLTGIADVSTLAPLEPDSTGWGMAANVASNPELAFEKQGVAVAENRWTLSKNLAWPNFSLGYMNQAQRNSPVDYRFKAAVGIPLWAGQYRGARQEAAANLEAARARAQAVEQSVQLEFEATETEALNARAAVEYYLRDGLPKSRALLAAALRMHAAGQINYVMLLQTLGDTLETEQNYLEQLNTLNAAALKLRFLTGQ